MNPAGLRFSDERLNEQHSRERRAHFNNEHDRIPIECAD
jgi:hypothetical protein